MNENFVLKLTNDIFRRLDELYDVYSFHVATFEHELDVNEAKAKLKINNKMRKLTKKYKSDLLEILK